MRRRDQRNGSPSQNGWHAGVFVEVKELRANVPYREDEKQMLDTSR